MRLFLLVVLVASTQGWARRRRLRGESAQPTGFGLQSNVGTVGKKWAMPTNSKGRCKTVQDVCGFEILCQCCSDSSQFMQCANDAISFWKRGDAKEELTEHQDNDEGGCPLRTVKYNGKKLCVPGNVAAMMAVISQAGKGCQMLYPAGTDCTTAPLEAVVYYTHFKVPCIDAAQDSLRQFGFGQCQEVGEDEIKCPV